MIFYATTAKAIATATIREGAAAFAGKLIRSASFPPTDERAVEISITVEGLADPEAFRTFPRDLPAGLNYYRVPADKLAGAKVALVA